jgi:hypothetical protein
MKAEVKDALAAKKRAALALLSEEARLALAEWVEAEADAYDNMEYEMMSYTHAESGAAHALSSLAGDLLEKS